MTFVVISETFAIIQITFIINIHKLSKGVLVRCKHTLVSRGSHCDTVSLFYNLLWKVYLLCNLLKS